MYGNVYMIDYYSAGLCSECVVRLSALFLQALWTLHVRLGTVEMFIIIVVIIIIICADPVF